MTPWDAATYEKVNSPHRLWAQEIIDRAQIKPGEVVLDAGCGGGSVTQMLLERTPNVIAVDGDAAMVETARATLPDSVPVYHQDLLELDIAERVDVVFSCAVFHWISDHDRLFERLYAVLVPGGRLHAQCGGKGNIANVLALIGERPGRWFYADPEETETRLASAGFSSAKAWLEPRPTRVDDMETFLRTVVLSPDPNGAETAARVAPHIEEIDYVRLNLEATV